MRMIRETYPNEAMGSIHCDVALPTMPEWEDERAKMTEAGKRLQERLLAIPGIERATCSYRKYELHLERGKAFSWGEVFAAAEAVLRDFFEPADGDKCEGCGNPAMGVDGSGDVHLCDECGKA